MAQSNTKDSLEESINRTVFLTKLGFSALQKLIKINVKEKNVICLQPMARVREINKFVVLFEGYRYNLQQLREVFGKTQYLIEVAQKKFKCVVEKINEILKYRSAIESKLIFVSIRAQNLLVIVLYIGIYVHPFLAPFCLFVRSLDIIVIVFKSFG